MSLHTQSLFYAQVSFLYKWAQTITNIPMSEKTCYRNGTQQDKGR